MSPDHPLYWPAAPAPPEICLQLLPERAVFLPESRTLFVADIHLGKAAVFRARGLPVPQGTTRTTLQRLSAVIDRTGASELVVLGDFLHARESLAPATMLALRAWRDRHVRLECAIVEGNHDAHAGQVHASFDMRTLPGSYRRGALHGVHHPEDAATEPGALTLAGHVHPVVRLSGRHDSLRLPCFWLRRAVLTLPAFGEFTGGFLIGRRTAADEDCFVVSDRVTRLRPGG